MAFRRRRKKRDRRHFRGVFLIPNLITTASLFAGFYAIVAAIDGRFYHAAWAIFISLVLDGLDGRIARITLSTSGFGTQYDSLSDLVAFGVAPGLLVYLWALKPFKQFGWLAAFLYVVCGALRLARFNVQQVPWTRATSTACRSRRPPCSLPPRWPSIMKSGSGSRENTSTSWP